MKKLKIILIILLVLIIALIFVLFIKPEYLTLRHFSEFSDYMTNEDSPIYAEKLKVIEYSDTEAKVYYYTPYKTGDILTFKRSGDEWVYESWDTYWSSTGNADRLVFPYWWHFIYFALQ